MRDVKLGELGRGQAIYARQGLEDEGVELERRGELALRLCDVGEEDGARLHPAA